MTFTNRTIFDCWAETYLHKLTSFHRIRLHHISKSVLTLPYLVRAWNDHGISCIHSSPWDYPRAQRNVPLTLASITTFCEKPSRLTVSFQGAAGIGHFRERMLLDLHGGRFISRVANSEIVYLFIYPQTFREPRGDELRFALFKSKISFLLCCCYN